MNVRVRVRVHVCACACVCVFVYVFVFVRACMCVSYDISRLQNCWPVGLVGLSDSGVSHVGCRIFYKCIYCNGYECNCQYMVNKNIMQLPTCLLLA